MSDQSFANHARYVPGYHFLLGPILAVLVVRGAQGLMGGFSIDAFMDYLLVLALLITALYARTFALRAQDRVIRLEERLRMAELLPADLKARIPELTTEQLIALRFASDGELPELVRRVLDQGMTDRKAIKAAVRQWRPDEQRL